MVVVNVPVAQQFLHGPDVGGRLLRFGSESVQPAPRGAEGATDRNRRCLGAWPNDDARVPRVAHRTV